jgi:putative hydrolase of the HAD superfamily
MESAIAAVIFDYRGVITSPPGEGGEVRPQMVAALDRLAAHGYRLACITNNTRGGRGDEAIFARFEQVLESARAGVRKPDPRIFAMMCDLLALAPRDCLYLDDIGANCAGAASIGMRAIRVESAGQALRELEAALGLDCGSVAT